jgi:hypothetical protein
MDSITVLLDARSNIAGVFELVDLAWFGNAIGKLPADNGWHAPGAPRQRPVNPAAKRT